MIWIHLKEYIIKKIYNENMSLHDLCVSGLARKEFAVVVGGGGGGGGIICGGDEYSNAYDGRRPSRRFPSKI
jgi:hypothetical protein